MPKYMPIESAIRQMKRHSLDKYSVSAYFMGREWGLGASVYWARRTNFVRLYIMIGPFHITLMRDC